MSDGEKKGLLRRGAEAARSAASDFAAQQKRYHSAEAKQERAEKVRNSPFVVKVTYLGGVAELREGGETLVQFSVDGVHAGEAAFYWWPQISELAVEDYSPPALTYFFFSQ